MAMEIVNLEKLHLAVLQIVVPVVLVEAGVQVQVAEQMDVLPLKE